MGIREGGRMAILAGVGPMGLAAIDYIIHCDRRPSLLIVTDIDDARLARAEQMLSPGRGCGKRNQACVRKYGQGRKRSRVYDELYRRSRL